MSIQPRAVCSRRGRRSIAPNGGADQWGLRGKLHDMSLAKKMPVEGAREEPVQALGGSQLSEAAFPERATGPDDTSKTITLRELMRGVNGGRPWSP